MLREVGDLRTGYQLRGAVDPVPEGPHRVVLLGDIQDAEIDWSRVTRTHLRRARFDDFLTPGDIIIRSRGANYGVVLVSEPPPGTVVAAPLFLLSVRRPDILPAYVAWYLNRPLMRRVLESMARGTSLPTISIRELGELEIPVPSLDVQREISEIVHLLQQERDSSRRLMKRRAQLADDVLEAMAQDRVQSFLEKQVALISETTILQKNGRRAEDRHHRPYTPDTSPQSLVHSLRLDQGAELMNTVSQKEINDVLWRACDTFRGIIDPSDYKNYILVMLFVKYISDVWEERNAELRARYGDNQVMIDRQLSRERFVLPDRSSFDFLYSKRNEDNVGEIIDIALEQIEDANRVKLEGVFRNISFNSNNLGETRDRNRRLKNLLEDFADTRLDLRPSRVDEDIIGNSYMYLIESFASGAGKKGGEFYTPRQVSILLAKLLKAKPGDRICDPACGSGSLLIRVASEIPEHERHNYSLYGQEANGGTWALCRMNMVLHDEDSAVIKWGDTLNNPLLIENDRLMKFNIVVANPPFSLDKWGEENAANDRFKRFWRAVPPKSKADYAFISHMMEAALPKEGRLGVIVPHGVLFRGGAEGKIRQKFIEENLLDTVVGLPENLFFGTGIPAAILIFDRSRETGGANAGRKDILFIDASREFQPGKNQNTLREEDIEQVVRTHHERQDIEQYSRRVPVSEVAENEFNLNIPRYIDTFEAPAEVDIAALQQEINSLESELATVRAKLNAHLQELELAP